MKKQRRLRCSNLKTIKQKYVCPRFDQTDRDASPYHLAARCEAGEAQAVHQEQPPDAGHCVPGHTRDEQSMPACPRDEQTREQPDPVPDTFLNTLCPTIPGPVVRLDEFHPNYNSIETNRPIPTGLTQDDLRNDAAEDTHEPTERAESSKRMDSQKDGKTRRKENCPSELEDAHSHKDTENRRPEYSRRLENSSRRMEETKRQENPRLNTRRSQIARWAEVRRAKSVLVRDGKWREMSQAEERIFQKDGKYLREEIRSGKKKKFGKAGNMKLTELEETILKRQMMRKREIQEIEKNLKIHRNKQEGRKLQEDGNMKDSPTPENGPKGWKVETQELRRKRCKDDNIWAWSILEESIETLRMEEDTLSSNRMENLSQADQRKILGIMDSQDGQKVQGLELVGEGRERVDTELCKKDGKPDKTSRQEEFKNLAKTSKPEHPSKCDIEQEIREPKECADEKFIEIVETYDKTETTEVITGRYLDRKMCGVDVFDIFERNDRKPNLDSSEDMKSISDVVIFNSAGQIDRKPPAESDCLINVRDSEHNTGRIAKLKPKLIVNTQAANILNNSKTGSKKKEDFCEGEGRRKEEGRQEVFAKPTPRVNHSLKILNRFTTPSLETTKNDSSVNLKPKLAMENYSCKKSVLEGSPLRGGGGKIMKAHSKRGTPSKLSLRNKIKLFEDRASLGTETGLVRLVQWPLNPQIKISEGEGGGGAELTTKICVNQSEGVTETRPRDGDTVGGCAGPGLEERCVSGSPWPMRCADADMSQVGGGAGLDR